MMIVNLLFLRSCLMVWSSWEGHSVLHAKINMMRVLSALKAIPLDNNNNDNVKTNIDIDTKYTR